MSACLSITVTADAEEMRRRNMPRHLDKPWQRPRGPQFLSSNPLLQLNLRPLPQLFCEPHVLRLLHLWCGLHTNRHIVSATAELLFCCGSSPRLSIRALLFTDPFICFGIHDHAIRQPVFIMNRRLDEPRVNGDRRYTRVSCRELKEASDILSIVIWISWESDE